MAFVFSSKQKCGKVVEGKDGKRIVYSDEVITSDKGRQICNALGLDANKTSSIVIALLPDEPARLLINYLPNDQDILDVIKSLGV